MQKSIWRSVFSVKYLLVIIYFTTLTVRTTSFPGWLYPWLKWNFSQLKEEEAERNVSVLMDIYGFSYSGFEIRTKLRYTVMRLFSFIFISINSGFQFRTQVLLFLDLNCSTAWIVYEVPAKENHVKLAERELFPFSQGSDSGAFFLLSGAKRSEIKN